MVPSSNRDINTLACGHQTAGILAIESDPTMLSSAYEVEQPKQCRTKYVAYAS